MKNIFFVLTIAACIGIANAALAPQYQNQNDLDVMIRFIKSHPVIVSSLKTIDFGKYTVYFGSDCKAVFARRSTEKPPGWAGPADRLEFRSSNCPVD